MTIRPDSLVLYKGGAARVVRLGEKIEIEVDGGEVKRVRNKDVALLHTGPLKHLAALSRAQGDIEGVWELMQGEALPFAEFCELAFGENTPQSAWSAWLLLHEGLWFRGDLETVSAVPREERDQLRQAREAKERESCEWRAFMDRVRQGQVDSEQDRERLRKVEAVALGQAEKSRVMKELKIEAVPEQAHRLLIKLKVWDETSNPYPKRNNLNLEPGDLPLDALPVEERLDLTGLTALAIDDEGNQDPDDALSWDGERVWVHVADPTALAGPGSDLDTVARERGATSYLPERITSMLPQAMIARFGLGLQPVSPALSIGIRLDDRAEIVDTRIVLSQVKVRRCSYAKADTMLDQSPLVELREHMERFRQWRLDHGAARLDLPEVKLWVDAEGEVHLQPLYTGPVRDLVTDAMLLAGCAVARLAHEQGLPMPYATQPPPNQEAAPQDLAAKFAYRKQFKRTVVSTTAGPHAGLGLDVYCRATSPLRRYSDLLVHQQLRAWLTGRELLDDETLSLRISEAQVGVQRIGRTERDANEHWKLVWLKRAKAWKGRGVMVEQRDRQSVFLIPDLAMETKLVLAAAPPLNQEVVLACQSVDLPLLHARFKLVEGV